MLQFFRETRTYQAKTIISNKTQRFGGKLMLRDFLNNCIFSWRTIRGQWDIDWK